MDTKLIALAIPFFFLLIGVESLVSRARGMRLYRLHDSIASLGCGIGEQVVIVFTAGVAALAYLYTERHLALTHVPASSVLGWILVLLLVDHQFYWFHRAAHRVNFLWAAHSVHHQSEEYNLSTALRQSWLETLLASPFYVPIALLGFPITTYATASSVNLLYQFWVHTRAIKRLGPAEGVLNTPSSHRVHHGIDPKYVDKNYGGMFMLWDRVYGTYTAEEEEPIYGTVKPLQSWSALWANVDGWVRIARMSRETSRGIDKVRVWFAPPDWRPADLGGPVIVPEVDRAIYRKYDTEGSRAGNVYVVSQFFIVSIAISSIMWFAATLPVGILLGAATWVIVALVDWGAIFEQKTWGLPVEALRHVGGIVIGLAFARTGGGNDLLWAAIASAGISLPLLARVAFGSKDRAPKGTLTSA